MHGIRLSFKRQGTYEFWPDPPQGVDRATTMMGMDNILEPLNQAAIFFKPHPPAPPRTINWESNWGLRAVGDAFGSMQITPNGQPASTKNYCVFELATAAVAVDDYTYVCYLPEHHLIYQ